MDNGAAEGNLVSNFDVVRLATELKCNELVLPDVMGDFNETLNAVERYLDDLDLRSLWMGKYMAVVQGVTEEEVKDCIDYYEQEDAIDTIALPRILGNTFHRSVRLELAAYIRSIYGPDKEIHCLGAFAYIEEVEALHMQGIVRGLDTSLPFVLGKAGIELMPGCEFVSRGNNDNFFFEPLQRAQQVYCQANAEVYLSMAGMM